MDQPLSNEELAHMFPIEIVEYDPHWVGLYEEEAARLRSQFGPDLIVRLEHFGSTAVPGLASKPVIDIIAEITSFEAAEREIIPVLTPNGYGYGWMESQPPGHMAFWKGYFPRLPMQWHVHMAPAGHPLMDRLLFRDYLRKYPETAREYERLKYALAEQYHFDRDGYTDAKTDYVSEITGRAKREFGVEDGSR